MQEKLPYLDWLEYINALLPSEMVVTENEPILVWSSQFFEKLGDVMKSTSNRTLANYIVWRAIYKAYKMQSFETGACQQINQFEIEVNSNVQYFFGKVRRGECVQLTSKNSV